MNRLAGHAEIVDEVHGFRYFDQRDLLGFVDGTENPSGGPAATAATIGDEDPQFAGASYVIVQKYLHDLGAWNALSTEEQEHVVGRTKLSDIELADDVKPSNSHVALNTITGPDGEQRQILRDNMAFGTVGDGQFGTYFIGYSSTPEVTEEMLSNMFLGKPAGQLRQDPRLLAARHREPVLRARRRFPGQRPERGSRAARRWRGGFRGTGRRLAWHREPEAKSLTLKTNSVPRPQSLRV